MNAEGRRCMTEADDPYRYGVGEADAQGVKTMWIRPGRAVRSRS